VNVFDVRYIAGDHVAKRWLDETRIGAKCTIVQAKQIIEGVVGRGKVILSLSDHKYIFSDGIIFPCVKVNVNTYIIKTVLTVNMNIEIRDGRSR